MSAIGFASDVVTLTANIFAGSVIARQWGLAAAHLDVAVHEAGTSQFQTFAPIYRAVDRGVHGVEEPERGPLKRL